VFDHYELWNEDFPTKTIRIKIDYHDHWHERFKNFGKLTMEYLNSEFPQFEVTDYVQNGTFGVVLKATLRHSGWKSQDQKFALKIVTNKIVEERRSNSVLKVTKEADWEREIYLFNELKKADLDNKKCKSSSAGKTSFIYPTNHVQAVFSEKYNLSVMVSPLADQDLFDFITAEGDRSQDKRKMKCGKTKSDKTDEQPELSANPINLDDYDENNNFDFKTQRSLDIENCAILTQIAEGVKFLHSLGITHRDLKPENILVNKFGTTTTASNYYVAARITDLGGCERVISENEKFRGDFGSRIYRPFGIDLRNLVRSMHTIKCDIYSFGIIAYVLLAEQMPYKMIREKKDGVQGDYVTVMSKLNGKQYKLKDDQSSQDIASQRVQEDVKNTQGRHKPHRVGTLKAPGELFFLTFHELWEPMNERIVEIIRKTIVIDETSAPRQHLALWQDRCCLSC
jgi:serine/threonine protein kinase